MMSDYIFEAQKEDKELRRLCLIEAVFDPDTITRLIKTGIKAGWCCLEIGAGAGSIALWMSKQVGPGGSVVAIDRDTTHLQALNGTRCEVIQGDFLETNLEVQFDLIHCRYVLIHNKNDMEILKKIRHILKPGGRVLLEEPDFTSARTLNPSSNMSGKKVNQAICRMFRDMDLDPMYGLHLPEKLTESGYDILDLDAALHFSPGNSSLAKLMAASAKVLREKYIASGEASEEDITSYIKNAENGDYWAIYYATISIMGKVAG